MNAHNLNISLVTEIGLNFTADRIQKSAPCTRSTESAPFVILRARPALPAPFREREWEQSRPRLREKFAAPPTPQLQISERKLVRYERDRLETNK